LVVRIEPLLVVVVCFFEFGSFLLQLVPRVSQHAPMTTHSTDSTRTTIYGRIAWWISRRTVLYKREASKVELRAGDQHNQSSYNVVRYWARRRCGIPHPTTCQYFL